MKTYLTLKLSLCAIITLTFVTSAKAQIVAWEMNPNSGNETTVNATTIDPNLNISTISRGNGLTPIALPRAYAASSYTLNGDLFDSFFNRDYLQFEISASSGFEVSLSTLDVNFRRNNSGPNRFIWMYSTNGTNYRNFSNFITYTTVGGNGRMQTQLDLSNITDMQNVPSGTTITIRLYGWGATSNSGSFAIGRLAGNDLSIGGTVASNLCSGGTTTWNGSMWNNGVPNITTEAVISGNYNTSTNGSFRACTLMVNSGAHLIVENNTFLEIENNTNISGSISVQGQGNFIQNNSAANFTVLASGTSNVTKTTPVKPNWFFYTYWSSPVQNETIGNVFFDVDSNRRFVFNAANYLDQNGDNIDDNNNDWQIANPNAVLTPGVGYAATSSRLGTYPSARTITFSGAFNTGDINTPIAYNAANVNESWNLLGNPYPSAVDFDALYTANNTLIDGVVYYWSQSSPASGSNSGNSVQNFSQNDYATYTVGTGGAAGASGIIPDKYIPSGQGFFINGLANGNVTFSNSMRARNIATANSQFFKVKSGKTLENETSFVVEDLETGNIIFNNSVPKEEASTPDNKMWLNLTTENGIFNQILIGYVNGATRANDGALYDAPRIVNQDFNAVLYSLIDGSNQKYAVQGKSHADISTEETVKIGFATSVGTETSYKFSIANLEGHFLNTHSIYLKDNALNLFHNLSNQDYIFTSNTGEFNDRFEIVFNDNTTLSSSSIDTNKNAVSIVQNGIVDFQFSSTLKPIAAISIINLKGQVIYKLNAKTKTETYKLHQLKHTVYIAKMVLADGTVVTKKFIKK